MILSPIGLMAHLAGGWLGGSLADDGWSLELAAFVGHGLLDHLSRLEQERLRNRQP